MTSRKHSQAKTQSQRDDEEEAFSGAGDADNDGDLEGMDEIKKGYEAAGESQELEQDEDGDGTVDALDFDGTHNLIRDHDAVKISADGVKRFSRQGTRECTDVFCIFFFIAYWIGMAIIGVIAAKKGDYRRLLYGTDYVGEQCNELPNNLGKKWMYYPNLEKDLFLWYNSGSSSSFMPSGICLDACPDIGSEVMMGGKPYPVKYQLDGILFHCFPMYDGFEAKLAMCMNHTCDVPDPVITLPADVYHGMAVTATILGGIVGTSVHEVELNGTHVMVVTTVTRTAYVRSTSYHVKEKDTSRLLQAQKEALLMRSEDSTEDSRQRVGRAGVIDPGVTRTLAVPGLQGTAWGGGGGSEWKLSWEGDYEEHEEHEEQSSRQQSSATGWPTGLSRGLSRGLSTGLSTDVSAMRLGGSRALADEDGRSTCSEYVEQCGGFLSENCTVTVGTDNTWSYSYTPGE
jgi:hypothetical protein